MNTTSETQIHPMHRFLPVTLAHGSVTEGFGAISTIILAILGLAGIFTNIVAGVATIVIGAVFLADGVLARATTNANLQASGTGYDAGMTAGFFGGVAAIVLGILSFFRPVPEPLLAIAVLVLGASLLLSGGGSARFEGLLPTTTAATVIPSSSNVFVGLGVTVLGILAVIGLVSMTLTLVGLLCLAAGNFFGGGAIETVETGQ